MDTGVCVCFCQVHEQLQYREIRLLNSPQFIDVFKHMIAILNRSARKMRHTSKRIMTRHSSSHIVPTQRCWSFLHLFDLLWLYRRCHRDVGHLFPTHDRHLGLRSDGRRKKHLLNVMRRLLQDAIPYCAIHKINDRKPTSN